MSAGQSAEHHGCERKSIQRDEELERFQNERCQDQSQKLDLSGMRSHAFDLSGDSEGKYDELLRQIGDAEIVLIGESTHGSHEFAEERCKITERLIEEKGFSMVVLEADLVAMDRVDRYVRGQSRDENAAAALSGFKQYPLWMWRNTVMANFVEWARRHNEKVSSGTKQSGHEVSLHGLDLHHLYKSLDWVVQYLQRIDPKAAERAKQRYAEIARFAPDPHDYGCAAAARAQPIGEPDVTCELAELRQMEPAAVPEGDARGARCQDDEHRFAILNGLVVRNGAAYYRKVYEAYEAAWSVRDRHMFENLVELKVNCERQCGGPCKVVVWAHNCHVCDARATEIAWDWHQINLGQLVKEKYGVKATSIGFTTHYGSLTAAPDWGAPGQCVRLKPSVPGTLGSILYQVSPAPFLLDCTRVEPRELCIWKRSIGLVYREDGDERENYYRANVFQMFDKIIHIPQTSPIEPLDKESVWKRPEKEDEMPMTYPPGI